MASSASLSRFWYLLPLVLMLPISSATNGGNVQVVTFNMRKLAFSTNQFGIDLYRALNMTDQNVAICPFCIGSSLAMVLLGSEGNTAMALRQALYLWGMHPQEIHLAYHDLIAHLGVNLRDGDEGPAGQVSTGFGSGYHFQTRDVGEANELKMVNSMYIQRHFAMRYPYQFYLQRYYNTSVHPLDFILNGEESMKHINSFFERISDGRTRQMLTHIPSSSTNLLLLNALYFKGTLDMNMTRIDHGKKFNNDLRDERRFPMGLMLEARKARVRYGIHDYLNCSAIEVPFKGGLISLLALLPNDPEGMVLLETRISAQRLTDIINSMQVKRISFLMPRILMDQIHGNLTKALYNLGLIDLFTPGYANLFGMSNFGWLHVTNMTHSSLIEVKESEESGQKARTNGPDGPQTIALDKPFLWFIIDNITGLALAMGKMVRPYQGQDAGQRPLPHQG